MKRVYWTIATVVALYAIVVVIALMTGPKTILVPGVNWP